jgi:uncharacterized protein (UPF0332 family)
MKEEINDLTEKTGKFLVTAQQALNCGDFDSCASRCYYAMFFMAEAVLLTKNLTASSHKGVISLFGEHFVKTKVLERNLGKALRDAYDKRLVGDYGVGFLVTEQQARDLLKTAKDFIGKLKDYLQKQI